VADSLQEYIVDVFGASKYKLAIAESCTGGLTSYKITSVPGASQMLFGSVATYSNDAKTLWLGVEEDKIDEYGAVSEETVSGMLEGVLKVSGADFAIAISGIAGPDGGTKDKPVGTVYAGVRHKDGESKIFKKQFYGDRTLIQSASADFALKNLCEFFKYFQKSS
jgi:nicotinamide-nucleotide amidase